MTKTSLTEVADACQRAAEASRPYAALKPDQRSSFLRAIAAELEILGESLIETACGETNLPPARITGERGRTCAQLRMFADLIETDSWLDIRIEEADPQRAGSPKPDLRRTQVPIGPVAVFGASNFPLAFSVPGGDTASALAAGCPVVCKGHPAHPETSELCAAAIRRAAETSGMPASVFQIVYGGIEVGQALVFNQHIRAVGFTGSRKAGRSLFDLAASRPNPIPVYAEMGSVNPVFLLPGALQDDPAKLAQGFSDSLTLGVGQFCTNPGIVIACDAPSLDQFKSSLVDLLGARDEGMMLTDVIRDIYVAGVKARREDNRLSCLVGGEGARPAVFEISGEHFFHHPDLQEELFGPSCLLVRCRSIQEMIQVADAMEGQLTATIHFSDGEHESVKDLMPSLVSMAGRVLANGFPTGVEVNAAMHHGGPYPATTDSRSTSVGTAAILRFVRPVAFQNFPPDLLPPELR